MSDDVLQTVSQICLDLERRQTRDSLREHLVKAAAAFGNPVYLLGVRGALRGAPKELKMHNWTPEWQQMYDSQEMFKVDPFLRRAIGHWGPFRWDDVTDLSDAQKEYRSLLAQHGGMGHGMLCSFPTHNSFIGLLSFGGMTPLPRATWPRVGLALHLITSAATRAAVAIFEKEGPEVPKPAIEFSGDERQCLELRAQGRTAKEIADELGFASERTVHNHLDKAAEKLGVKTRGEAVTEALALGLIRKRHFGPPVATDDSPPV